MKATALVCDQAMHFQMREVNLPEIGAEDVLVRTAYSGVSIGTEFALIRNKISWGPFPIVTGYMGTGIVEAVGPKVSETKPGDKVFFRGNAKMQLADGTAVSAASGTHCSHIVTQVGGTHGLSVLPEGASMETASMFVMPAVGYNGVNMAEPKLGQAVVVHGCGLIGLGVVAAASLRGCMVLAVDVQDRQLQLAQTLGADFTINASASGAQEAIYAICPEGADAVFECTGEPKLVDKAIALCRPHGKFVWQGNYGREPTSFAFLVPHGKRLQMFFPCDDGLFPCRHTVIKQMARGVLPWEKTITHHIEAAEAPTLFDRINKGDKGVIGATIHWA